MSVSCFSLHALISMSPRKIWPLLTRSNPARQCSSVDLPDPDGPMIAVNCAVPNSTLMPSSARTSASPDPYTLYTLLARAIACCGGAGAGEVAVTASALPGRFDGASNGRSAAYADSG